MDPITIWIITGAVAAALGTALCVFIYLAFASLRVREERLADRELRLLAREEELMREQGKNIKEAVMPIMRHLVPNANMMAGRYALPEPPRAAPGEEFSGFEYEIGPTIGVGQAD